MDTALSNSQSEASNDVFSLSNEVLSERLQFLEEIGCGNWGSVWLCQPKPVKRADGSLKPIGQKLAVKLVHRSKTSTSAARVRSLWNEMKIIKSLKTELHPSIIPFHSFIITPKYALITMSYLPTLVPVEVEESKARQWFQFLLSGVEFLHARGVVHNDIKPANILLSHKNVPVLVDFGFAERYELMSDTAFHSSLSYGTPEYLSPERARGLPHDTRKSDVWSLGVTFFEILVGRTPFEKSDGEQLTTKEDLEKYWERTLRGKWVGEWVFSAGVERLLQRMISPNADLRCTAKQAMADMYWRTEKVESACTKAHKRAASCASTTNSSVVFEHDLEKLLNAAPSAWKGPKDKRVSLDAPQLKSPPGLNVLQDASSEAFKPVGEPETPTAKVKSQHRAGASAHTRKHAVGQPPVDLSPVPASPATPNLCNVTDLTPSASSKAKENISHFNKLAATVNGSDTKKHPPHTRAPFGALSPNNAHSRIKSGIAKKPSGQSHGAKAVKLLGNLSAGKSSKNGDSSFNHGVDVSLVLSASAEKSNDSTNVKDRMREWEREKQRLREMERLEELERERDQMYKRQKKERRRRRAREEEKKEAVQEGGNATVERPQTPVLHKERSADNLVPAVKNVESQLPDELRVEDFEKVIEERVKGRKHQRSGFQSRLPDELIKPDFGRTRKASQNDWEQDKENIAVSSTSPVIPMFSPGPRLTHVFNMSTDTPRPTRIPKANKGSFKRSLKASIDKTIEFCKSGRTTPARFSFDVVRSPSKDLIGRESREPWESELTAQNIMPVSPLPLKGFQDTNPITEDAGMDRMAIWMRNVEKVVEDAKQNFATAVPEEDIPLPGLTAPLSRNTSHSRTSRLPRRILAASQIFQPEDSSNISSMVDTSVTSTEISDVFALRGTPLTTPSPRAAIKTSAQHNTLTTETVSEHPCETPNPDLHTPSRQRRATVSIGCTIGEKTGSGVSDLELSPSKRKEKSKSQSNIFEMHIAPLSLLEAELAKTPPPQPTPRLSQVIDRKLFIAPKISSRDDLLDMRHYSLDDVRPINNDLTSSPYHVEPYPQRRASHDVPQLDTPARHKIEGVYDRFLMATSGVKRLGKGYQSENLAMATKSTTGLGLGLHVPQARSKPFYSTRRAMPPPVSSEDLLRMTASVDELGNIDLTDKIQEDSTGTKPGFVRKAIKLMAPKTNTSKRISRIN